MPRFRRSHSPNLLQRVQSAHYARKAAVADWDKLLFGKEAKDGAQ